MTHPEDLPREQLETRQLSKLREQWDAVLASNPFWQSRLQATGLAGRDLRDLSALQQLPTLTKSELVADQSALPPYGSNHTAPLSSYTRLHQTSGTTTGQPLRWLDTPRNWGGLMECWRQIYRLLPLRSDHRCCFPFSFGPFLGFWAGFEAASAAGRFVVAAGSMSSEARLQLIADNRVNLIGCTPTYAARLVEVAEQAGIDLRELGVDTILVAGEPGGNVPLIRDRITSAWGADVVDHWGMTEVGPLGISAEGSRDQLTILETECIAEILDPDTDTPVAAGEMGELTITTLARIDSPVFRFRTGDLVCQATDADPRGRSLLRLQGGVRNRVDDMLIIRGNNVFPSSIEGVLHGFSEIAEYRLIVGRHREMDELKVEIEPHEDLGQEQQRALSVRISNAIKDRLNFKAAVSIVHRGALPRFEMKARRIVRE